MEKPRTPPPQNTAPLPHVRRVIAIASGKGGVGKSTVTVQLALMCSAIGLRVGILDADIYGPSIPRMLGLMQQRQPEITDGLMQPPTGHGIRAMSMGFITGDAAAILRGPMITKTLQQLLRMTAWGTEAVPLDLLLVDMPPGTGDVHLSMVAQVPLDGAVIVTTPQEVAVMDARKCLQMFMKLQVPIRGIVENMSGFTDSAGVRHALFGEGGGTRLAEAAQVPLLGSIPFEPALGSAADAGENFLLRAGDSEVTAALQQIATQLLQ